VTTESSTTGARTARWVATIAGLIGFVLSVLTPLLPVVQTTATLNWPQAGQLTNVTAPLISLTPVIAVFNSSVRAVFRAHPFAHSTIANMGIPLNFDRLLRAKPSASGTGLRNRTRSISCRGCAATPAEYWNTLGMKR